MLKHCFSSSLLLLTIICNPGLYAAEVPLDLDHPNWQTLEYKGIPPNTVRQIGDAVQIDVNASASPLIYVFNQPQELREMHVSGSIIGDLPDIRAGILQGDKNADDFAFRIGLVIAGSKTLNFAQKLVAADWVTTLYELAPEGEGIDHIQFLNLANPDTNAWRQRVHPSSKGLFVETIVDQIHADQDFMLDYALPEPTRVLALWISSDGDDTASSYTIKLNKISYQ